MNRRIAIATSAIAAASLLLGGCSATSVSANRASGVQVLASFYQLQYVAQQVGGHLVHVTSLTPPGAEPHDIELSPREVRAVSDADVVVYLSGFQSAVDAAIAARKPAHVVNAAHVADLVPAQGTEAKNGALDPHFWLDPQRYSSVANVIATRLSNADPANRAGYQKNAIAFENKLAALSTEFTTGLANCQRKDIVTSHAAFGYLAKRFGIEQIAINGLSPEQEPNATEIAAVSSYAKAHGVTTVYAETLVSPAIAATVANESGAKVSTLDPIEGLTKQSNGKNYFEVMRSNLTALRAGQGCS